MIFVFKNLRAVANQKLLIQTYRSLCECIIRYCICAWGSAGKTYLITAERAQRGVLKVLLHLPFRHPTTVVYEKAKVLTIRKLFIFDAIRRYHSRTVPNIPVLSKRVFRYPIPNVRTSFARKHYSVIAPRLYNILDKKCKTRKLNSMQLKIRLQEWLQNMDYDAVEGIIKGTST
ncbi:hypothetical protein PYW07_002022 [Mythimna separata]|nr:hypothetical protein PYW07_002022 [Mythimna separata]